MNKEMHVCPKCGRSYSERPALSREDNETAICPECGMMEALASIPKSNRFPRAAAQLVLDWMNEQMYGEKQTVWSSGNEHDRMREAADLLDDLCKEQMLKRVCCYGVYAIGDRPCSDRRVDGTSFTVFGHTTEELDEAMESRFAEAEKKLADGEYIDDCGWGDDVPAVWNDLTEEWT